MTRKVILLLLIILAALLASLAWFFVIFMGKPVHYAWVGTLISCILTSFVAVTWLWIIIRKSFKATLETG